MDNQEGLVDYSRQASFDELSDSELQKGIPQVIVGCGGVGFWLGIILAMHGYKKLILIDGDRIEGSNLNRLPVPPAWIGTNKAVALRKIITNLRPYAIVSVLPRHFDYQNPETTISVLRKLKNSHSYGPMVWDCTDHHAAQKALFKLCEDLNINYRKIGYERFEVGTYTDYNVWTTADAQQGYRTTNACASTSALAAVVGLMSQMFSNYDDVTVNLETLLSPRQLEPVIVDDEDVEPVTEETNEIQF